MSLKKLLAAGVLGMALSGAALAQAPAGLGCKMEREDHYICNRDEFVKKFNVSSTVAVNTARLDNFGGSQMRQALTGMGKTVVTGETRPDLVFELSWLDRSGRIDFGPSDISLAFLRVYAVDPVSGQRRMVWSETWDGQDERPWPAIVGDLLRQFHDAVAPRH